MTLYTPPDPMEAVRLYLAESGVAAGAVYAPLLPPGGVNSTIYPNGLVVVRRSGLPRSNRGYSDERWIRVDVRCYGPETYPGSGVSEVIGQLEGQVYWLLTKAQGRQPDDPVWRPIRAGGCTIYSATENAGPIDMVDPDTDWPVTLSTYDVFVGIDSD